MSSYNNVQLAAALKSLTNSFHQTLEGIWSVMKQQPDMFMDAQGEASLVQLPPEWYIKRPTVSTLDKYASSVKGKPMRLIR
jgi:hypothetical protein